MRVMSFGMIVFLQPEMSVLLDVSIIALQLLRESYIELRLSTLIFLRLIQPVSTPLSEIFLTPSGIVILVRLAQLSNAPYPMLVTFSGIIILVRLEQP